jgi:hypothetical protein
MSFKSRYPDFAAIERHVRHARAERAVAIATACADAIMAAGRGLQRLAALAAPALKHGSRRALVVKASVPRPAGR